MARYSVSACRSCSRNRADSARVRFRSARPHIPPAVRATIVVRRSASADSPPDASVAIHVTTVTATIASAITAARRRRSGDRAGPGTGDAREPNSAVATPQGDLVNSDNARSQRRASFLRGTSFAPKGRFLSLTGDAQAQHDSASAWAGVGTKGRFVNGLLLGTLFVPWIVLVVPLYIEVVDPPLIHHSFAESYWAIWLPAGATAFNVVLMKRFFDNLPRELFEAARIDGAGALRLFFSIVLPLSKPILGVVSIFAILSEWKNFLWPFLILTNSPDRQPLSVRLPAIQAQTQIGVLLASMLIASLVPLLGFLIFQRTFLRGTGLGGALKG